MAATRWRDIDLTAIVGSIGIAGGLLRANGGAGGNGGNGGSYSGYGADGGEWRSMAVW